MCADDAVCSRLGLHQLMACLLIVLQAFPTADGYLVCGATNDVQFRTIALLLELDHLLEDKRYATNPARVKHRTSLIDTLTTR
jgi:succinate--hydroxymethylglutarate CoA-transferase